MKVEPVSNRREFLKTAGLSAAALPFLGNLPTLGFAGDPAPRKKRLVVVFTPNGTIPWEFWPEKAGPLTEFKTILKPLEPFRDRTLTLNGLSNRLEGDGDRHMRGIGCLLTGIELFPGNIQGGSDSPAGWASGHSIDQEIARRLQADEATRTRFGALVLGVNVPERADTWTRMSYAGPNRPIAPLDDPYAFLGKMYGDRKSQEALVTVLDDVTADLRKLEGLVGKEDKALLDKHATFVRDMERRLQADLAQKQDVGHAVPELEPGVVEANENLPKHSAMQIELLSHAFEADFARVATLQFTNSVGNARLKWLGVSDSHHGLSHEPDSNKKAVEDLIKINTWYAEQVALLCKRLSDTPEPGVPGQTMLDNTTVVWTNELGKGNSHSLDNIPFVCVGGGLDWAGGRALDFGREPHNRLLLSMAKGFGYDLPGFGNEELSGGGPLEGLAA